jgi:DnaJ-class molecular chaperone
VPRHLSEEQRALLEEFDSHADERTYKPDDEGFFDKLKSAFR